MLFSSISFLFVFLPAVLLCYFVVPKRFRNGVLLFFSLLFYFYGEPKYTVLLLASSLSDYLHSLYIEAHRGEKSAKVALISSLIVNLLMLGVFKYADFIIGTVNSLFGASIPLPGLELPIGISFFTFQTMSYTIDVYRGRVKAERNIFTMATYVSLFPQLVAGPIVRYETVAEELRSRSYSSAMAADGARRFVVGLAKKVLLANTLGGLSTQLLGGSDLSLVGMWMGTLTFMMQVYFDFSGYSDMAIGLGKIFGFTFPENFDYPFMSKSITEFWRRWHMTLGSWFRDYVYFPLGGSHVKHGRWIFNLVVVWALTGLWHGADWNFVLWGLFFAVLLPLEKLLYGKPLEKAPAAVQHIVTMLLITISFAIFNADAAIGYQNVIKGMFGFAGLPWMTVETAYYLKSYAVLLIVGVIGSTPLVKNTVLKLQSKLTRSMGVVEVVGCVVLLVLSTAYLVDGSFNPFLYFRF
ncbi:hypothetical protein LJC07_03020 [Christensenellaceae bacterium OttesenSCG-928-L17]|nr:hypothetical protein [Christensenellaceae bacterium OttesenSCG-928-L17]